MNSQLKNHKLFLDDIHSIEEERNFYYRKLRLIEKQCSTYKRAKSSKEIMKLISAEPEDFVQSRPELKKAPEPKNVTAQGVPMQARMAMG